MDAKAADNKHTTHQPLKVYSSMPVAKFHSCMRPSAAPTTTLLMYVSGCAMQVGSKPFSN